MKFVIVFLITFAVVVVLTSAQNSYQQCGVAEQARIRQLESENQQLRNNNQAMAAAGGMMVGFLSGYAGCQNSNPKTTTINVSTQSNELAETVKTLAESHQALAESHQALVENHEALVESHQALSNTVKDLQEQMSQVNAGIATTEAVTTEAVTTEAVTTEAETTTPRSACENEGHLFFDGKCYFVADTARISFADAVEFCSSAYAGGELVSITSQELYDALVNYIRPQMGSNGKFYWTSGTYDPDAGADEIVWNDGSSSKGWDWHPSYPRTTSMYAGYSTWTHIFLGVNEDETYGGLFNHPDNVNNFPLCTHY